MRVAKNFNADLLFFFTKENLENASNEIIRTSLYVLGAQKSGDIFITYTSLLYFPDICTDNSRAGLRRAIGSLMKRKKCSL